MIYANYGEDPAGLNYGKNIFLSYETRVQDYGVSTGQGIKTNLFFTEAKVSYLINPKYNLRAEVGGIIRKESSALTSQNTGLITFGIRSTFRNLYRDF